MLIGLRRKFARAQGRAMLIYLFRDESDNDIFAFSIDVTGANIPAVTPHTEWIFLEALDTLKFPDPGTSPTSKRSGSSEGRWVLRLRG